MYSSLDTIWVLLGAALVFFMQAGFAMVETGFTRAKNAGNIIMKNLMDFSLGSIIFWILGFGIMFGGDLGGFIGTPDLFVRGNYDSTFPTYAFLIFQTVFCATAATIVSGAMAERTKFSSYCVYSVVISAIVYPISGHWIWGGGWLSQIGFHDFAGSTAVHMVGGVAALIGAKILGPRIGKYSKEGRSKEIAGHNLPIGALGVFILWFCWFGFNGCSTVSATGDESLLAMSSIFVTTNLAAAAAATCVMVITWIKYKTPSVNMTLNGALGGLVAITAGCDMVSPSGAFFIGLIAGIVVILAIDFIDKKLKIDDPVGAIAVHGCCGAIGTILTGVFALDGGLLYGGGLHLLGIQTLGVVAVIAWVSITMLTVFIVINKTLGLRVDYEEEIIGLDLEEHGLESSYADFMPTFNGKVSMDKAVPVHYMRSIENTIKDDRLTKIVVILNKDKISHLTSALNDIGIFNIKTNPIIDYCIKEQIDKSLNDVSLYKDLIPKVKMEFIINNISVRKIVSCIRNVIYTGVLGDGNIIVYDIDEENFKIYNDIKVNVG